MQYIAAWSIAQYSNIGRLLAIEGGYESCSATWGYLDNFFFFCLVCQLAWNYALSRKKSKVKYWSSGQHLRIQFWYRHVEWQETREIKPDFWFTSVNCPLECLPYDCAVKPCVCNVLCARAYGLREKRGIPVTYEYSTTVPCTIHAWSIIDDLNRICRSAYYACTRAALVMTG